MFVTDKFMRKNCLPVAYTNDLRARQCVSDTLLNAAVQNVYSCSLQALSTSQNTAMMLNDVSSTRKISSKLNINLSNRNTS